MELRKDDLLSKGHHGLVRRSGFARQEEGDNFQTYSRQAKKTLTELIKVVCQTLNQKLYYEPYRN
jgi:hypothetical protein